MDPETLRRGLEWFNFVVTIGMISLFGLFLSLAYIGEGQKWARALVYMGLLAGLGLLVAFGLRDVSDLPRVDGELVVPDVGTAGAVVGGEGHAQAETQQDPGPGGAELTAGG